MTKLIPLTRGKFALVDNEDFNVLQWQDWREVWVNCGWYAALSGEKKIYMHRVIMHPTAEQHVLHLDDNGLNNTRTNLMIGSARINTRNGTIYSSNTSGTRGVCFNKAARKYVARISCDKGRISLGHFDTLEEAVAVRKAAEAKYWRGCSSLHPTSD